MHPKKPIAFLLVLVLLVGCQSEHVVSNGPIQWRKHRPGVHLNARRTPIQETSSTKPSQASVPLMPLVHGTDVLHIDETQEPKVQKSHTNRSKPEQKSITRTGKRSFLPVFAKPNKPADRAEDEPDNRPYAELAHFGAVMAVINATLAALAWAFLMASPILLLWLALDVLIPILAIVFLGCLVLTGLWLLFASTYVNQAERNGVPLFDQTKWLMKRALQIALGTIALILAFFALLLVMSFSGNFF